MNDSNEDGARIKQNEKRSTRSSRKKRGSTRSSRKKRGSMKRSKTIKHKRKKKGKKQKSKNYEGPVGNKILTKITINKKNYAAKQDHHTKEIVLYDYKKAINKGKLYKVKVIPEDKIMQVLEENPLFRMLKK
tara:strand:+ start:249 stop:644 length:396 start_codon:yes stop_codon:yes gene_type:complete